ncbi:MAG: hypothetical protein R3B72_37345 [Polyangiaceae bacterium]
MRPAKPLSLALGALLALLSCTRPAFAQPIDDVAEEVPEETDDPDANDVGQPNPARSDDIPKPDPGDPTAPPAPSPAPEPAGMPTTATETNCTDRIDNDGDSVFDCGDADCYDQPVCKPSGVREKTDQLCSDWVDNDGDGSLDCDDDDCAATMVCQGFLRRRGDAQAAYRVGPDQTKHFNLPELDEGMSIEEIIGRFGDNDGERNDYTCSDGVDNDGDGRTDCADFGCRFDSQVTVCQATPGFRFSVVGQVAQTYRIQDTNAAELDQNKWDTRFSLLQLRFLGPIGNISNSFFLINLRAETTPRLTFALFQLPIGNLGHYFNINSGGGGLTSQLIISNAKQLLLERAFLVYSAFEQGNGAAIEFGGPIDPKGRVNFRAFGAGGSGRFSGNVGGRFFADDNTNYTWGAGAQFLFNIAGYYGRFDTPYIYTPVPLKAAILVGGKYDQRAQERYPAWNGTGIFRWWHFHLMAETYWKRELEFGSWQYSYYAQLGALLWPRHLMLAADYGEYIAGDLEDPPTNIDNIAGDELRRQRDERQFRGALHWYAYEQTGLISLRYTYRDVRNGRFAADGFKEQDLTLFGTYRF